MWLTEALLFFQAANSISAGMQALEEGKYQDAAEAYDLSASHGNDPELRQKATLAAGEMYDVLQKRETALEKYRTVIAEDSSSDAAGLARRYMKQAYRSP